MDMGRPKNTLPMMTGTGPFGPVGMGGMFSVVKVRRHQKPGDYKNPGWYQHPVGEVAFEWTGAMAEPARPASKERAQGGAAMPANNMPAKEVEVQVRKPTGKGGHSGH